MSNNSYYNDQWRIINEPNQNKVSNYSMEFDGSSDLIDCGNDSSLSPTSQLSVSAWVNNTGTGSGTFPCIISNVSSSSSNGGFVLSKNSNKWKFYLDTTGSSGWVTAESNGTVVSNSWQHLCATWDGSTVIIYLNGQAQTTTASASQIVYNVNTETIIGEYAASYFQGKIDQVSIFDYALPATGTNSVATLYGGGTAITNPMSLSPKPIAYYQLGDQSVDNGAIYLVPNNSLSDYVFNFDGTNGYINAGTGLGNSLGTYTGDASVSLWFKADTTTGNDGLFSMTPFNGNTFGNLRINISSNILYFVSSELTSWKTIPFTDTTSWHHLVCIFKSGDITNSKIYLDGLDQTTTNTGTFPSSLSMTGKKTIIGGYYGTNNTFDGELSNVSFFNTELTSTQVETIYNNGSPNDISSLSPTAWYKLNAADTFNSSTSTWTINDYGSGGNDGTSSGMTSANLVVSDLQQTSGYSPYSLSLDGINDYLDTPQIDLGSTNTISFWINTTTTTQGAIFGDPNGYADYALFSQPTLNRTAFRLGNNDSGYYQIEVSSGLLNDGNWHHHCLTRDGVTINYYIDGILQTNVINNTLNASAGTNTTIENIFAMPNGTYEYGGKLSNVALWNIELTSTEVTEIYNEGHPSDLNTFSGTAPVSWWQIGSNSSYNSGAWTCLDEIGTNNAVSVNMTNDDIVDGVGYSASGLGTSSIDIKGDAPYSTANGLSENMDVLDRTTDVPS